MEGTTQFRSTGKWNLFSCKRFLCSCPPTWLPCKLSITLYIRFSAFKQITWQVYASLAFRRFIFLSHRIHTNTHARARTHTYARTRTHARTQCLNVWSIPERKAFYLCERNLIIDPVDFRTYGHSDLMDCVVLIHLTLKVLQGNSLISWHRKPLFVSLF